MCLLMRDLASAAGHAQKHTKKGRSACTFLAAVSKDAIISVLLEKGILLLTSTKKNHGIQKRKRPFRRTERAQRCLLWRANAKSYQQFQYLQSAIICLSRIYPGAGLCKKSCRSNEF